jgi:hypothetical protein
VARSTTSRPALAPISVRNFGAVPPPSCLTTAPPRNAAPLRALARTRPASPAVKGRLIPAAETGREARCLASARSSSRETRSRAGTVACLIARSVIAAWWWAVRASRNSGCSEARRCGRVWAIWAWRSREASIRPGEVGWRRLAPDARACLAERPWMVSSRAARLTCGGFVERLTRRGATVLRPSGRWTSRAREARWRPAERGARTSRGATVRLPSGRLARRRRRAALALAPRTSSAAGTGYPRMPAMPCRPVRGVPGR